MVIEFEAKFLDVNVQEMKEKLKALNAIFVADRFMKRQTYDFNSNKDRWMRLRDDGKHVTLTIKEIKHKGIDGTFEDEVVVSSFEKTSELLALLGFKVKHYQENKRLSYVLDNVAIELDSWPGIPTYLELDGSSKKAVLDVAQKLDISVDKLTSINTFKVYDKYGKDIRSLPILTFSSFPTFL